MGNTETTQSETQARWDEIVAVHAAWTEAGFEPRYVSITGDPDHMMTVRTPYGVAALYSLAHGAWMVSGWETLDRILEGERWRCEWEVSSANELVARVLARLGEGA
jgi:hypothetical protein